MKILFNSVGNRHLKYPFTGKDKEGKAVEKNLYNEKFEFKTASQKLLENFDKEKCKVDFTILKDYLEQKNKKDYPDKIILFGTDQEKTATKESHKNQDTYWAALIIKNIVEENYNIPVEVVKVEQNPADENELIPFYQSFFKNCINQQNDAQWFFLDAGGTPQQKLACKLLIPEINPITIIEYLSNVVGVNKQDLVEKKTDELEKIFFKKSVKQLIEKAHYQSAYELLYRIESQNPALPFIKIGKYRMQNTYKDTAGEFTKYDRNNNPVVLQFIQQKPCVNLPELEEKLNSNAYFLFGEYLARTNVYFQNSFNEQFILSFQQSCEFICWAFLENYAIERDFRELKNEEKLEKFLKEVFNEDRKDLSIQLKVILKICKDENLHDVESLFSEFAKINNSYNVFILKKGSIAGLDSLRNKVAHKAQPIAKIPKNIANAFNNIIKLTDLDENSFNRLNDEIKRRLF
ncbi:MAG: hypothetical protein Kow0079_17130 [Vicingaceae bacterium]